MSLVDYSDLEREIESTPELEALPKGSEVKARIISVRSGESDKNDGAKYFQVYYDVPSEPTSRPFNDFFWDLIDARTKLDAQKRDDAYRKFRAFISSFGIDISKPFNWEDDLTSLEGWMILGVKKSDERGIENTVQKYLIRR